jgi:hypothetical protein
MRGLVGEQRQDHELEVLRGQPPRPRKVVAAAAEKAVPAAAEAMPPAVPAHGEMGEMTKVEVFVVSVLSEHIVRLLLKTYLTI